MPIKRCKLPNGKSGYKYGDQGKCYPTREQALKQMRAIKYSETHGISNNDIDEFLRNKKDT